MRRGGVWPLALTGISGSPGHYSLDPWSLWRGWLAL